MRAYAATRVRGRLHRMDRAGCRRVAGQDHVELAPRADAELGEDLAQVVLDRARADEEPAADLRVREALAGEPGDLGLLRGEVVAGGDGALADRSARGRELAPRSLGVRVEAHRVQQVVCGPQ